MCVWNNNNKKKHNLHSTMSPHTHKKATTNFWNVDEGCLAVRIAVNINGKNNDIKFHPYLTFTLSNYTRSMDLDKTLIVKSFQNLNSMHLTKD